MSPFVKRLVKETGVKARKAESAWSEAITIAEEMYGMTMDKFGKDEFDYAYQTALESIRKQEIRYSLGKFVESGMSARDYIEMVVSGDFSLDHPMQNKDDEEEDDENEPTIVYESEHGDEEPEQDEEDSEDDDIDDLDERVRKLLQKEYADKEINTDKVYEDEDVSAFDDIPLKDDDE